MIRVLIADDEELARNKIRRFFAKMPGSFAVSEARNGLESLQTLREGSFDLVLLDIEMPGLTGFEVLQNLEHRPFKLIFQTAFDEFAIRAFEENACDYLLKPFDFTRFEKAVTRALARAKAEQLLHGVEQKMQSRAQFLERISVRVGAKTQVVNVRDIDCFTSQDHYTTIHCGATEFLSELSLGFLEKRLNPREFCRLHRNALARMERVRSVLNGEPMRVELEGGRVLPVARARRKTIKNWFDQSLKISTQNAP